jgi:hypothetical protein
MTGEPIVSSRQTADDRKFEAQFATPRPSPEGPRGELNLTARLVLAGSRGIRDFPMTLSRDTLSTASLTADS